MCCAYEVVKKLNAKGNISGSNSAERKVEVLAPSTPTLVRGEGAAMMTIQAWIGPSELQCGECRMTSEPKHSSVV